MSPAVLLGLGAVLCFAGARSIRVAVLAGGFAVTWLLAEVFDASTATALIVSAAGAVLAFLLTLFMTKFLFFVAGGIVGSVIGARFFVLVDGGEGASWLLAVVFVPAVAVMFGVLANRFRHRFMIWCTAFAGAALLLSGLGRLDTDVTEELWRPDTTTGSVVSAVLWGALTVLGYAVQRRGRDQERDDGLRRRTSAT